MLSRLVPAGANSTWAARNSTDSFSLKPPKKRCRVMTSCSGNVKLAFRSSPLPVWEAAHWGLGVGSARLTAKASQLGVASMTPLRASMNSMLQPRKGSMRAVPPMSNAFDASRSTL